MAGPADELAVEMNVRSSAGDATGTFVADLAMPGQSVSGTVSVRHLNLAPIVNDMRQRTDLTADARLDIRANSLSDLESMRGTVSLNAPRLVASGYAAQDVKVDARVDGRRIEGRGRAAAYGAAVTAAGTPHAAKGERAALLRSARPGAPPRSPAPAATARRFRRRATNIDTEYHVRESSRRGDRRPVWSTAICGSTPRRWQTRASRAAAQRSSRCGARTSHFRPTRPSPAWISSASAATSTCRRSRRIATRAR